MADSLTFTEQKYILREALIAAKWALDTHRCGTGHCYCCQAIEKIDSALLVSAGEQNPPSTERAGGSVEEWQPMKIEISGRMEKTIADHVRACEVLIGEQLSDPVCNSHLVGVLCDSVRMAREFCKASATIDYRNAKADAIDEVADEWHTWTRQTLKDRAAILRASVGEQKEAKR